MAAPSPASLAVTALLPPLLLLLFAARVSSVSAVDCPDGYTDISSHCFMITTDEPKNWTDAEAHCGSTGGYLAVLSSCHVLGNVVAHINALGLHENQFWIGGSDEAEEGTWLWVTGERVQMGMPFWGQVNGIAQPAGGAQQNCLHLDHNDRLYFSDGYCDKRFFFVCQARVLAETEGDTVSAVRQSSPYITISHNYTESVQ